MLLCTRCHVSIGLHRYTKHDPFCTHMYEVIYAKVSGLKEITPRQNSVIRIAHIRAYIMQLPLAPQNVFVCPQGCANTSSKLHGYWKDLYFWQPLV